MLHSNRKVASKRMKTGNGKTGLPVSLTLMILHSPNRGNYCDPVCVKERSVLPRRHVMSHGRKDFGLTSLTWDLRITNRRWRYDDFNNSGRHVIDEAGDEPVARQCRNRPERSDVDYNRGARIPGRFGLEFRFLDLKIARQKCRVASEARDAAIGVLKYDEVKLPAASRDLSGNLTNSSE